MNLKIAQGNRGQSKTGMFLQTFVPILFPNMPIVTLSDSLIQRLTADDRRILRDKVLSGFCLRLNKRSRTFIVATSCNGQQVRITVGRWPLISVQEARRAAAKLLLDCRSGKLPLKPKTDKLPTLSQVLPLYAKAKGIKSSSLARYESILKVHFKPWQDHSITVFATDSFSLHCHEFAQAKGAALVEVGRGLIGAIIRYINAVYGLEIKSPFDALAAAGLMPQRAQPRLRKLQEGDLSAWYKAVQCLPEKQRDLLMLLAMTGLRRNEAGMILKSHIDIPKATLHIPGIPPISRIHSLSTL